MKKPKKEIALNESLRQIGVMSRRQFLSGLGGLTVQLPLLPSLLPRSLWAASNAAVPKRFVGMMAGHGAVRPRDFAPAPSALAGARSEQLYSGHSMVIASLKANANPTRGFSTLVNEKFYSLLDKMNVMLGLDIAVYGSEHHAGLLGNFKCRGDTNAGGHGLMAVPSVDWIISKMAGREALAIARSGMAGLTYTDQSEVLTFNDSVQYQDNVSKRAPLYTEPMDLFVKAISPNISGSAPVKTDMRIKVVDQILKRYQDLRGNANLSRDDRSRLNEYIEGMNDIENRIRNMNNSGPACTAPTSGPSQNGSIYTGSWMELMNDVLILGFRCGAVVSASFNYTGGPHEGDWHTNAHSSLYFAPNANGENVPTGFNNSARDVLRDQQAFFLDHGFGYLAKKMSEITDANGRSMLDNSFLMYAMEHSFATHGTVSMPVITAGSAGGRIRTGQYLDYRNMSRRKNDDYYEQEIYFGLLYNRLLNGVLQAFDVPSSEYLKYQRRPNFWFPSGATSASPGNYTEECFDMSFRRVPPANHPLRKVRNNLYMTSDRPYGDWQNEYFGGQLGKAPPNFLI